HSRSASPRCVLGPQRILRLHALLTQRVCGTCALRVSGVRGKVGSYRVPCDLHSLPCRECGRLHVSLALAISWRRGRCSTERKTRMPRKTAPAAASSRSWWTEEEPGIRIPYHVIRHAMGKSGPVRIQGLELTRAGDVLLIRAVHTRGHTLPQFIEVPLSAQILRRVAMELEAFAAQAEADMRALHRRRQPAEQQALPLGTQDPE